MQAHDWQGCGSVMLVLSSAMPFRTDRLVMIASTKILAVDLEFIVVSWLTDSTFAPHPQRAARQGRERQVGRHRELNRRGPLG